jgi:hypothetical protein
MDLDTFLTTVYVMIDDYCKAQGMNWMKSTGPKPSLTLSEVLSLVVLSRWHRFSSDRDFYRFADQHLRAAFPNLPAYSQFNRLMRAIGNSLNSFNQFLVVSMQVQACVYEALDTMGCATRNAKRRGEGWLAGEANIGYSNRLGWYEGLNVMTSVTPDGFISGFGCAPASTKEQRYADTFFALRATGSRDLPEVGRPAQGTYITDNGFCGKSNRQRWQQWYSVQVITPPQRSHSNSWSKALRRWLSGLRQIVETVHEKLLNSFRLDRERPHLLQGFRVRLAASVTLHNFCIWLNIQLGRPKLAFADLIVW